MFSRNEKYINIFGDTLGLLGGIEPLWGYSRWMINVLEKHESNDFLLMKVVYKNI